MMIGLLSGKAAETFPDSGFFSQVIRWCEQSIPERLFLKTSGFLFCSNQLVCGRMSVSEKNNNFQQRVTIPC